MLIATAIEIPTKARGREDGPVGPNYAQESRNCGYNPAATLVAGAGEIATSFGVFLFHASTDIDPVKTIATAPPMPNAVRLLLDVAIELDWAAITAPGAAERPSFICRSFSPACGRTD